MCKENEFKDLVNECMAIDQYARSLEFENGGCDNPEHKLLEKKWITASDSTNMATLAAHLRNNPLPSSVEFGSVKLGSRFFILCLHWLGDSVSYSKYPAWQFLDSLVIQAVHEGRYPASVYLMFLDRRHMIKLRAKGSEPLQLFGRYISSLSFDSTLGRDVRRYYPSIDDLEHIDDRRRQWCQPTLAEEQLIDPERVLPENYR